MTEYAVIAADPAWLYRVWSDKGTGRSAAKHYRVSAVADMGRINVLQVAARDCILAMWATWPNLFDAFRLARRWSDPVRPWIYKTVLFTWVKSNRRPASQTHWTDLDDPANWFFGTGHYTRANTEFMLLFTRGRVPRRLSKAVSQLIVAPLPKRHSQKPAEAYRRIEQLFEGPHLELFARDLRPGWDVWGDQAPGGISLDLLPSSVWEQRGGDPAALDDLNLDHVYRR